MPKVSSMLAAGSVVTLAAIAGLSAAADLNWTSYGGSADSSRYFDSKEINKSNVGKLQAVWSYPFGEAGFHPIIVHNTVYTRGRDGALIALDAKTGRELWIHDGNANQPMKSSPIATFDGSTCHLLVYRLLSLQNCLPDVDEGRESEFVWQATLATDLLWCM